MTYIICADIESLIKKQIWKQSTKIFNNKNMQAYSLQILNVNNLDISTRIFI